MYSDGKNFARKETKSCMTYIPAQLTTPLTYKTDLFSLRVEQKIETTTITMHLFTSIVNTFYLPHTVTTLKTFLPSILRSTCFNDNNLPFAKEAKQTEIGHLFEHILLEYLCEKKLSLGLRNIVYNGVTEWNWQKDQRGIFYITIDTGSQEKHIFEDALQKSIVLISEILRTPTSYLPVESSLPLQQA